MFGEDLVRAFGQLKGIFDPDNLMNLAMSGYPSTTSAWAAGLGTRRSSACKIVTSVLSLPTRARATSKPCSGSSESRL
jgi:hypothetical protein